MIFQLLFSEFHLQLQLLLPAGSCCLRCHLFVETNASLGVAPVSVIVLQMLFHFLNCSSQPLQLLERSRKSSCEKHQAWHISSCHRVQPRVESVSDETISQQWQLIRKKAGRREGKVDTCVFRGHRQLVGDFPSRRGEPGAEQRRGTKTPGKQVTVKAAAPLWAFISTTHCSVGVWSKWTCFLARFPSLSIPVPIAAVWVVPYAHPQGWKYQLWVLFKVDNWTRRANQSYQSAIKV